MTPLDARDELFGIAYWMGAARSHDPALALHSFVVSEWTERFVAYLGYPQAERQRIIKAAFLHDIGKIKIPAAILTKPDTLNSAERLMIRSHPDFGYELLKQAGETDEVLLSIVRDHHERLDGTGYPRGLMADDISTPVRIVALCDVFSAMTEPRPYAEMLPWNTALETMFAKRTRLDLELLKKFAAMVRTSSRTA